MVTVLVILAIFLSFFCLFVFNKQHIAVLLVVIASNQMAPQSYNLIYVISFTAILHFSYIFLESKNTKSLLLILLLPMAYILTIYFIQPYKINIHHYLGYLSTLFIFAWVTLIKWTSKEIVNFLSIYGSYLILTGFIEKATTDTMRVGSSLTVATAYAVVLVITWTIWLMICSLEKIYTKKTIAFGTFLVFFAVIFSGTRMGLLGILIGLGLCGLATVFMKNKNINIIKIVPYFIGITALLIISSILVWNLLPNDLYIKKTFSTLITGKLDDSNMGRVLIWISAINIFEDHKFLGIGPGNFPEKCKLFFALNGIHRPIGVNTHAHNIYLIMLSEHGLIGFLILITFAFLCISRVFLYFLKNRNSSIFYAFLAGFIVMATLGLVDATPMYLPTAGFAAWFFGTCASFKNTESNIC